MARCVFLLALTLGPVSWSQVLAQEKKKDAVEVTVPADGAEVERVMEIEGRLLNHDGMAVPILFVSPVEEGIWYVQHPVRGVDPQTGEFTARASFGRAIDTGKKFRLVVLVAKDAAQAKRFKTGDELPTLPTGMRRSKTITVVLSGKKPENGSADFRTIKAFGYTWQVRDSGGKEVGPGRNVFSEKNVEHPMARFSWLSSSAESGSSPPRA